MKKIIRGRKYDTDTAELVGEYQYSYPRDFNYCREELYRKRTGEFFLYGTGGPLSKYGETTGQNEWSGSEAITPLDLVDAKDWVEENCDAETYEKLFGVVDDDGEKVITTISLSKPVAQMLEQQAIDHRAPKSEWIEKLIKKENQ
jgi:hypothetical protein